MSKGNMFDTVFDKPEMGEEAAVAKQVHAEEPQNGEKTDGLFSLKDLPESDRKPTKQAELHPAEAVGRE